MSDPPPTKPKVGSLRDRIAAFENKPAAPAGPAPVPRPKPAGGATWKPRAVSPAPPSEPTQSSASSPPRDKKGLAGMSASDAKDSIGMGGSLKERMAALQGRGAFSGPGGAPAAPPKPATDKPKWKPPPRVVSPSPGDETTPAGDVPESAQSPPPDIQDDSTEVHSGSAKDIPASAEAEGESGEPDPEEEERQRRAAIAARMARLGGARVGMAPPIFGKKPSVKKPETPKDEEAPAGSKPAGSSDDPITSSSAVSNPDAVSGGTEEGHPSSGDYTAGEVQRKNSNSSSLLSADTSSQTPPAKSPTSMPIPAVPRRTAPPRKKVVKSPSPAPPVKVLEDQPLEESPAPMSESQSIISPHPTEEGQHIADRQEEVGEVGKSADPIIDAESTASKPPTSMLSEGHMVAGSPEVEKSAETETKPSDREFGTVEPEIYIGEPAASPITPPAVSEHQEAEDQVADTQSVATSPPPSAAGTDDEAGEHGYVSSEEEAAPAPPVPAELNEEEEEAARRKRVAEKFSTMGGVNPLAPPPPMVASPPSNEAGTESITEAQKEILASPVISPSSPPTQAASDTVSSPSPTIHAHGKQASQGSGTPSRTNAATSSLAGATPRSASIDVPEDVYGEGEHPEDVASQYDAQASTSDRIEARTDEDDDENEDDNSNYSDAPLEMSAQQQGQDDEWAQSEEEDDGVTAAAVARMQPPPAPPNISTRSQPADNVANRRTSQGPERASIPAPPRRASSPLRPEASAAHDASSPPSRSIPPPPPPVSVLEDDQASAIDFAHLDEPEEVPSHPRRSMPPPPRRQTVEVPSTYIPQVPTSPPSKRTNIAPSVPSAFALEGSDIPSRTATPPAPTSPPSRRTSVVPPVPGAFSPTAPSHSEYPASPPVPPSRPPPPPTSPPSRRTSVIPPVPGAFSSATPSHSEYPAAPPAPPSRPPPPPTSPPSRRTSVVPPVPRAFSPTPPSHSDHHVSHSAPPSRPMLPFQEPGKEVLGEEEGDPIDPGFHSPTKTPPSPAPVPGRALELEEESAFQADPEQARRRTIAERMAKLGGITFGGPLPVGRPSVSSPLTNVRTTETELPISQGGQPEEADMDEEEEERARKERIAAKLSSMGGVGMFGAPPPRAAPRAKREASEDTINAVQSPPSPLQRTVHPPSAPPLKDSDSEFESHGTSGASDDGVKVEAEDSELEEVRYEDAMDEEEAPPVVPSRAGRSNSGVSANYQSRKSVDLLPPVPGSRPPVPANVVNRQSSVRKSSADSHATPSTRRISLDPSPASAAIIASPSDYVMVEEEGEAPPPPPSRPNRGPPTRAPPPPLAESTMGSAWEMPSSSPVGDFDGPPLDLSFSASSLSEDSNSHPTQAPSHPAPLLPVNTSAGPEDPPVRVPVQIPQEMSADDLMAVWGRVGVQICEVGTTLHEKSKRTLIGDGSYLGFLRAVFSQVPNAMLPSESSEYGYLIYAQTGSAVQRRASDIMPGDVIALYDAKLKGHKGLQLYHQNVGAMEPLLGIVSDYEIKKSKVKVFHANQHVGQQTVESVSYRLEDLKSGAVKIFRVLEA